MKTAVGIDNGVTGTIAILGEDFDLFYKTPVKKEQNYTKTKDNISRINVIEMNKILEGLSDPFILIERPMVNPRMFKSTISAIRALEATLGVIELLKIPFQYIDSKEWQREMLPSGIKGNTELKKASMDIGIRLFPHHSDLIRKQKDADGLLIAEYCRRKYK